MGERIYCHARETKEIGLLKSRESIIFTPPLRSGRIWHKVNFFKRSLTGLNSEFSFSLTSSLTKAEETNLPSNLPIAGGRIIGFIPFPRVLVLCEMQSLQDRESLDVLIFFCVYMKTYANFCLLQTMQPGFSLGGCICQKCFLISVCNCSCGVSSASCLFQACRQLHRNATSYINKSLKQHPTKQQLYSRLPPISKTIKIRCTRHAGLSWRRKDEHISGLLRWTPSQWRASVERPARTHLKQLCTDTECSQEDPLEAMDDRKGWQGRRIERERKRKRGRERE